MTHVAVLLKGTMGVSAWKIWGGGGTAPCLHACDMPVIYLLHALCMTLLF